MNSIMESSILRDSPFNVTVICTLPSFAIGLRCRFRYAFLKKRWSWFCCETTAEGSETI